MNYLEVFLYCTTADVSVAAVPLFFTLAGCDTQSKTPAGLWPAGVLDERN
jgi:hypothetical protein